jgi:hypothetical protein
MTDKVQCELWIAINEDGGYVVVIDESEALEKLIEDEGGYAARVVKITALVRPPVIEAVVIDVPDEAGKTVEHVEAE